MADKIKLKKGDVVEVENRNSFYIVNAASGTMATAKNSRGNKIRIIKKTESDKMFGSVKGPRILGEVKKIS